MRNQDEKRMENLRSKACEYELPNQTVIELAYCVKDLWELTGNDHHSFDQTNCRNAARGAIGHMLQMVDDEYKQIHEDVVNFFEGEKTTESGFLSRLKKTGLNHVFGEILKALDGEYDVVDLKIQLLTINHEKRESQIRVFPYAWEGTHDGILGSTPECPF